MKAYNIAGWFIFVALICSVKSHTVDDVADRIDKMLLKHAGITNSSNLGDKLELVFVVDSSGTVGQKKLDTVFKFLLKITRIFTVHPTETRVAVIEYRSAAEVVVNFWTFVNQECLSKELKRFRLSAGWTNVKRGVEKALNVLYGSRHGSKRVVFLFTDGEKGYKEPIEPAATKIKSRLKAEFFVFAINKYGDIDKIFKRIPSSPKHYFELKEPEQLEEVMKLLNKTTYDACSGSGIAYDRCERRCTCVGGKLQNCHRVRKDFTSMTRYEQERFLKALKIVATKYPYRVSYNHIVKNHGEGYGYGRFGNHWVDQFLPWHRYFLLALENLLRQVDCRITVPYWDWSLWAHDVWSSPVWNNASNAFGGNGSFTDGCVTTGPFAFPGWKDTAGNCVRRNWNGIPPDVAQVQYCLSLNNFRDFEIFIKINLNYLMNMRFGGTMGSRRAANAPEFILHCGFIDKIWDEWQKKSSWKLKAHFSTDDLFRLRLAPYLPNEIFDNNNLPSCTKVAYDDPTHGESQKVLKFVRGLSRNELIRLPRLPFTKLKEKVHRTFYTRRWDRPRARELEEEAREGLSFVVRNELLTETERMIGFKLVKP